MRNLTDTGISLPPNPEYLDFPRTDGNISTWPPNTKRIVDHEGQVNYYEHVSLEHAQSIRWRVAVGDAVALKLALPVGPKYVFRDFPDGYRFYDHNKGPHKAPRHDLYLFGPVKKRFRSVNEFIPHAIWLMGNSSEECECKYCGKVKKPQREITASMSNILRTTPTMSPTPKSRIYRDKGKGKERDHISRRAPPRPRDTKVYAAVQRAVKPMKPSTGILQQPMLVERANDLRAMNSTTSMHLRRWFRDGEVVWCALNPPILAPGGTEKGCIEFWPGVIEEIRVKTLPIPRDVPGPSASQNDASPSRTPQASSSAMQIDPPAEDDQVGTILPNSDEVLPWTVRQFTRYKVQLLGVSHEYVIDDSQGLPYQAYLPSEDLIANMTKFPVEKLNFDKESLLRFNPCARDTPPTFFESVSAYATALQIASIISSTWCLTDDYTVRYTIPPSPKPSSKSMPPPLPPQSASAPPSQNSSQPLTLAAAIEAAGRRNAQLTNSTPFYKSVTSVDPTLPARQAQKIIDNVLGVPPPPSNLVQTRFQGLWWGAERVWANDFIRLKVPRRTLGPKGGPNILPASGPGKSSAEQWIGQGKDPSELGAGTRGVFMRLDGLVTVDVVSDRGVIKKEARVCGMLYELAEEDWDDPEEQHASADFSAESSSQQQQQQTSVASSSTTNLALGNLGNDEATIQCTQSPISGPAQRNELPQAPVGYRFRPIIAPGHEFVGAMGLISGRYYPTILSHPKTTVRVQAALARSVEDGGLTGFDNLWALEGLSGGYYNSVDPHRYKKSRIAMMQDADKQALEELQAYVKAKTEVKSVDAMEVDD